MTTPIDAARAGRDRLIAWLVSDVFPLWSTTGTDTLNGGFFEKISADGKGTPDPRRARVVGRQIYSFSNAPSLGWDGPAEAITRYGLSFLERFRQADGSISSVIEADGTIVRPTFDLYDYAFVLFGLAAAANTYPWARTYGDMASEIRQSMSGWKHETAGFDESRPRTVPLRANPHMHLLEASLAWMEVNPQDRRWGELADEIAQHALDRFICHSTGALFELYDAEWRVLDQADARFVEPGHQCEWGWLLSRWGRLRRNGDAIVAARLLVEAAERQGVDEARGVMFNELNADLTARETSARLWPQTERIKGWIALYALAETDADRERALDRTAAAIEGLLRFARPDIPGAYYDRMLADGSFVEEAAPASSLYHIVCAARELQEALPA